jgi:4-hydroxy-3-polyprenylbenzoate decarboxylase
MIFPPVPAFYNAPQTVQDLVDHTVGRVLDVLGIEQSVSPAWPGLTAPRV